MENRFYMEYATSKLNCNWQYRYHVNLHSAAWIISDGHKIYNVQTGPI